MNGYIKELLQKSEIQKLLSEEKLDEVYRQCQWPGKLTDFFLSIGIDPLKYVTVIINNMYYRSNVERVIIPKTITAIEELAFQGCENLKYIEIPETINEIHYNAFNGCYRKQVTVRCKEGSIAHSFAKNIGFNLDLY